MRSEPVRGAIKRAVMWAYCAGLLPARVVRWAFRVFNLRCA